MRPDAAAQPFAPPMPPLAHPGTTGLGVLAGLRRNGFSAFPARCLDEPVVRLRLPGGRALVLASAPDSVRHVLQAHAEDYRRMAVGRRVLGPIVGRGLLVSEGEAWRRQRRTMAPAFTPRTVPVMAGHVMRHAEAACMHLDSAAPGERVDLLGAMQSLSLNIAAASMFSLEAESFGGELRGMVSRYMATIGRPSPGDFLVPKGVPTPLALRRALFRRRWRRLIAAIIAQRRAQDGADCSQSGSAPPRDLFDLMAAAHGDGADDLLADEVATMIVAGHETTALAMFWALLLLAQVPHWQAAVAAEARGLDLSPDRAAAALPALARTRAVVQEALRLYPPGFVTAREAVRAHEVCGVTVPARAVVLVPFWMLHRNRRWWAAPDAFDPDRFLHGAEPDRFAFLPFGAGPHACIGSQLAMTEAVLVLARLLRDREVSVVGSRAVLPVGVLSTRPDHAPDFLLRPRQR